MAVMAAICVGAIGYMIFGRVSETVDGNAIFMTPGTVVSFQAAATGQIRTWHVRVGDQVTKGQLLAELEQPMIEKQLDHARDKLASLESRDATLNAQSQVYLELELESIARKKATLEQRIRALQLENRRTQQAVDAVHTQKRAYLEQREKDLEDLRELNDKRRKEMEETVALTAKLKDEGLRSEDQLLSAKRQLIAQDDRLASVELQLVEAALDSSRAAEVLLDSRNRIADSERQIASLEDEYRSLISREAQLNEQVESDVYVRQMEISEVKRDIARYSEQLTEEREVRAEHDGRIIELNHGEGERVNKGVALGMLDTREESAELAAVAFFKLEDGKKLEPGMIIRLTPAIAEQERYGGIIGTVQTVSKYPVTTEGATRTVGNSETSRTLTEDGHFVEVYARLHRGDTPSGYEWERFGGPDIEVSAGTLASARVDTKSVRPISLVIPGLSDL